jgi:hypothetical protein
VDETTDPVRVRYVKVHANPGFLTCQQPECEGEPAVKSAEIYSHAWEKHRTNYIHIEA